MHLAARAQVFGFEQDFSDVAFARCKCGCAGSPDFSKVTAQHGRHKLKL